MNPADFYRSAVPILTGFAAEFWLRPAKLCAGHIKTTKEFVR